MQHDLLVQHLVVLEMVQQHRRRPPGSEVMNTAVPGTRWACRRRCRSRKSSMGKRVLSHDARSAAARPFFQVDISA